MFDTLAYEGWMASPLLPQGWIYQQLGDQLNFLNKAGQFVESVAWMMALLRACGHSDEEIQGIQQLSGAQQQLQIQQQKQQLQLQQQQEQLQQQLQIQQQQQEHLQIQKQKQQEQIKAQQQKNQDQLQIQKQSQQPKRPVIHIVPPTQKPKFHSSTTGQADELYRVMTLGQNEVKQEHPSRGQEQESRLPSMGQEQDYMIPGQDQISRNSIRGLEQDYQPPVKSQAQESLLPGGWKTHGTHGVISPKGITFPSKSR